MAMPTPRSFHSLSSALNRYSFALLLDATSVVLCQLHPSRGLQPVLFRFDFDFDAPVARTLGRTRLLLLRLWTWPLLPVARAVGIRLCTPLLRLLRPPGPLLPQLRRQKTCWERKWRHVRLVQPPLQTLRILSRRRTPWHFRRSAAARVRPLACVSRGSTDATHASLGCTVGVLPSSPLLPPSSDDAASCQRARRWRTSGARTTCRDRNGRRRNPSGNPTTKGKHFGFETETDVQSNPICIPFRNGTTPERCIPDVRRCCTRRGARACIVEREGTDVHACTATYGVDMQHEMRVIAWRKAPAHGNAWEVANGP